MSTSSFHDNLNNHLDTHLDQWCSELGFQKWGAASLLTPVSLEFYRTWIEQNYHGEMDYLRKHLPVKENPKLLNGRLESALVFAHSYVPHPRGFEGAGSSPLRTALYAQGEDYHFWLKEKLEVIASRLRASYPDEVFLCLTDSSPILERDLAYRAGLGWVGKNTCLIDPKEGSFFLIGEIVTSWELWAAGASDGGGADATVISPVHDFCGTCTRCLDVCPTGALEAPRLLNASKCISYLTIESRNIPASESLRRGVGDLFFGCDLCQTVCPWNEKAFRTGKMGSEVVLEKTALRELNDRGRALLISELREILVLSGKRLQRKFEASPLQRAGPFGLRRNAILVATNQGLSELRAEIGSWADDPKLGELVKWSLERL